MAGGGGQSGQGGFGGGYGGGMGGFGGQSGFDNYGIGRGGFYAPPGGEMGGGMGAPTPNYGVQMPGGDMGGLGTATYARIPESDFGGYGGGMGGGTEGFTTDMGINNPRPPVPFNPRFFGGYGGGMGGLLGGRGGATPGGYLNSIYGGGMGGFPGGFSQGFGSPFGGGFGGMGGVSGMTREQFAQTRPDAGNFQLASYQPAITPPSYPSYTPPIGGKIPNSDEWGHSYNADPGFNMGPSTGGGMGGGFGGFGGMDQPAVMPRPINVAGGAPSAGMKKPFFGGEQKPFDPNTWTPEINDAYQDWLEKTSRGARIGWAGPTPPPTSKGVPYLGGPTPLSAPTTRTPFGIMGGSRLQRFQNMLRPQRQQRPAQIPQMSQEFEAPQGTPEEQIPEGYPKAGETKPAPNPGNSPNFPLPALPRPTSAQQAYDQTLAQYNSPEYAAYYNSLAPSTRAYMHAPGDQATGEYLANLQRDQYTRYAGKDPFGPKAPGMRVGGIASLVKRRK